MIGNLDYIIDNVSEKYGIERRIIEAVAVESMKRLKKNMTNSEALSLYFPQLGYWVCINNKLRKYVREYVKKLRKTREKIKSGTVAPEKMEAYLMYEQIYVDRIRIAWSQLEALRYVFLKRVENRRLRELKKSEL